MPVVTFACPECGNALQSAKAIPAGKKIKCPTCSAVFRMPDKPDEELAAGVGTKPRRPAVPAPARDDDEDAAPRRKASRVADDEDDEDERPRRRSRDDDEDEDDEDERPRKKTKAVARRRVGGTGLLIGAVCVVLLLFLAGGGIGAYFIWFAGVNRGSGNEDPLAFVPKGAEFVAGVDGEALLSDSTLGPEIEKSLRQQAKGAEFIDNCKKETGLEFKELYAHTVIAGDLDALNKGGGMGGGMGPGMGPGMGGMGGMGGRGGPGQQPGGGGAAGPQRMKGITLILRPSRPFDQKKMARSFKNPVRQSAHGKTYYDVSEDDFRTVFMPSDRTLIVSSLPATELDALFASDGTTPSVSADTVTLVRSVEKTTVWAVLPFEGQTRTKVDEGLRNIPMAGAEVKPLQDHVAKAKGVAVWGALEGNQASLGVNLACADAAGASQLVQSLDKSWQEQKGGLVALLGLVAGKTPKTAKLATDLINSLKFTADGAMAKAAASTSRTALVECVAEVQAQQKAGGGGGAGNGFGRGGNPGGGNPGGGRGGNPGGRGR